MRSKNEPRFESIVEKESTIPRCSTVIRLGAYMCAHNVHTAVKAHRSKHTRGAVFDIYLIRRVHGRWSADKSSRDGRTDIAGLDDAPIH